MGTVWMIQRKECLKGRFLQPSALDIQLFASKEKAKKELEFFKKWAEWRGCEVQFKKENYVEFTDEDGYTWVYTLQEKIIFI